MEGSVEKLLIMIRDYVSACLEFFNLYPNSKSIKSVKVNANFFYKFLLPVKRHLLMFYTNFN